MAVIAYNIIWVPAPPAAPPARAKNKYPTHLKIVFKVSLITLTSYLLPLKELPREGRTLLVLSHAIVVATAAVVTATGVASVTTTIRWIRGIRVR